jgi:uncharacterized protein YdgA (DUF945 family)
VKKIISIVVVLLILASGLWAGGTYWFGLETEKRYHALLQQASDAQFLKFTNQSYSRGFAASKAQTVMEFQIPPSADGKDQSLKITLAHDITHGPFPLGKSSDGSLLLKPLMAIIETRVVVSPEFRSTLEQLYGQIPEIGSMRDYTLIHLDGGGEENFTIPAFQHTFGKEEKFTVDWKGLFLQFSFSPDLKGFKGSWNIPGLEIGGKGGELKVGRMKSTFDVYEAISGLSLGDVSFGLESVEILDRQEAAKPSSLLMRGFSINVSNKVSGDIVNGIMAVRTDQLKLDDMRYGPAVFELALRNLDAASMARVQQIARETQAQLPPKSAGAIDMQLMLAKYAEILPGLLKKSPELEITQLSVKTAEGDFTGQAKIAIDGTKAENTQNLLMMINAITAQAELKVGERLLHSVARMTMKDKIIAEKQEQDGIAPTDQEIGAAASAVLNEQLQGLTAMNLIVKENDSYSAKASYKAGEVVLNGRQLPLQDLMK